MHEYRADHQKPWSIYWMHFDGSVARTLFERYCSRSAKINTIPFDNERIILFDQVYQIFNSGYTLPSMEFANILGLRFLSSFIYHEVSETVGAGHREDLVNSITNFLIKNLDKSFTSEEIAETFHYSSSYIFHRFKKRTGYSLIHFFNLKKVQKACEYLKYGDLNVKEIAYLLGFEDPLYFSRAFKKYMGVSPRAYKKEKSD